MGKQFRWDRIAAGGALRDDLAQLGGIPEDDAGGEQVHAGDAIMLPFAGAVPDLAATVEADGALQGVVGLTLVESDLGLALHAGVLPQWSAAQVLEYAEEVQQVLRSNAVVDFLRQMYGNSPDQWSQDLDGAQRLRVIVNALTRLRFCTPEGQMDFASSESASQAPAGLLPWFDAPQRRTAETLITFGHWSTLGLLNRPQLLGLDTGCVWGGSLTVVGLGSQLAEREFFQLRCPQAQRPG